MTGVVVLALMGAALLVVLRARRWSRQQRLVSELRRADRHLSAEYQRARRAMNDAAGQSWRNLTN